MNEQEIIQRFEIIEKRLNNLEGKPNKIKKEKAKDKFSGLSGGIKLLIEKGFLNKPKFVAEVFDELKKENYHYPKKSVEKLLSIDFRSKQKVLNRINENKKWKYVLRK